MDRDARKELKDHLLHDKSLWLIGYTFVLLVVSAWLTWIGPRMHGDIGPVGRIALLPVFWLGGIYLIAHRHWDAYRGHVPEMEKETVQYVELAVTAIYGGIIGVNLARIVPAVAFLWDALWLQLLWELAGILLFAVAAFLVGNQLIGVTTREEFDALREKVGPLIRYERDHAHTD